MAQSYASNGPISRPPHLPGVEANVQAGGFAFSVTDGIFIPVDPNDDDILTPPTIYASIENIDL